MMPDVQIVPPVNESDEAIRQAALSTASRLRMFAKTWPELYEFGLAVKRALQAGNQAKRFDVWHEDDGDVLWWVFPIVEPPYVGSPLASDWPFERTDRIGWTRLVVPSPAS